MSTFTATLPAADAFGVDAKYIVIHPERGEIHAPCSSRQITVERFGFAARGGYQWALIEPNMAKLLLAGQFAEGATGDSEVVRLRDIAGHAITVMRAWSMNDKSKSEARQAAADDLWAKLHPDSLKITPGEIISAPGGPFELEKGETPHAP